MTYFLLGLYASPLVRADWRNFGFDSPLFPYSEHVAGSIRVFNDGSCIRSRLPVLL